MDELATKPVIPADVSLPEITFKAVVLGIILTIILAAANAYLGLKVGTTVSASIPAAVISMGILRLFRNSNILENTMVQIMASVGETLTAGVAFILPALLILHVWDKFNYWETVLTSLLGGSLGVLFTIPLRRALLKDKSLRYPEAQAIGNVLKVGAKREAGDLNLLMAGGLVSATIALLQSGFQVFAGSFQYWYKSKTTIIGFGLGLSPALIAAGYIVGINVALSLFVGIIIGWVIGVPALTWHYGLPNITDTTLAANFIWSEYIRYIGVGTMLVGSLWTLCTLFKPVMHSMKASLESLKQIRAKNRSARLRTERDIPIHYVLAMISLLLILIFFLIACKLIPQNIGISSMMRYFLSGFSTFYILLAGFAFCSITAYFAGLIGSTNSPLSGMLVSALLIFSLILSFVFTNEMTGTVIAISCMVVMGSALSISNDTMQDLKVGQIVGATPWKQQVMLALGVIVSAFVIPLILQLLYNAYGIGGAFPRAGMDPSQMLAAPQAGLMAAVAKGVFSHHLAWSMISLGAVIAILCVIIDEVLKRHDQRLPVLAVGLGIYLPLESSMPVVIGGFLAYLIDHALKKRYGDATITNHVKINKHQHRGLLLACGMVAGASLMGVILAVPFALSKSTDVLRIMPTQWQAHAGILSVGATILLCIWMYRIILRSKFIKIT